MSAQGEDVLAWLTDVISARKEAARLATPGAWRAHDTHLGQYGYTATVLSGEDNDTELRAWLPSMSQEPWNEIRNVWNDSKHIALNDPASVLRRCAADQTLLELHGGKMHSCPATDDTGYLDEWTQFGSGDACPVVRLLADSYGWTEGER